MLSALGTPSLVLKTLIARHLLPRPYVRDPLLIPRHHHFRALRNRNPRLAPRTSNPPRSLLRIDKLARPAFPDRKAQLAQHTDHVVIRRVQRRLARHQHPREKP